ncbi:QcrA and Rieske domain-containing protein [Aquipuribacter sp. SD81]|uniref:QcrA and Rieske domain-containing protein n=1 Tax=Aquipuribacter sp. SD81 TaxID=3127703 RepID=UPI003017EF53
MELPCTSRRVLLRGLAAVGVTTIASGVLVACGGEDPGTTAADGSGTDGSGADGSGADGSGAGASGAGADGASASGADGPSEGGGAGVSVPLADVPVGEAVVVDSSAGRFVVAQPTAGEVVAFSAACTHQGTPVVADGGLDLRCPNHGSRFDAADGAVLQGPASEPLAEVPATVEGDLVVLSV